MLERQRPGLDRDQSWQDTHVQAEATESGNDPDTIAAAQGVVEGERSEPEAYEVRHDGIHIYPRPDRRSVFRCEFTINPAWGMPVGNETDEIIDQRLSVVDAWLIIHAVCAEQRDHQGDINSRDNHRASYANRMGAIRGYQHSGETWNLDEDAAFEPTGALRLPNWDLGIRRS
jgi:hypothetical protein